MKLSTLLPRLLLAVALLMVLSLPSRAQNFGKAPNALGGKEKPKKGGEVPPRPTPPPGPREGGDSD